MRAGTSPFLNSPSLNLSQGRVLPHHTDPRGAPAPSPIASAHHPHRSGPLCPCTAQSHLYTLDTVLQYHTWWDLTFPASPRSAPPRAAQALHRQHPQAAQQCCGQPHSSWGTSSCRRASHHQPPHPRLHFVRRYFITALLPKSPSCMSDARELCSTSKHQEGVQRSSARVLGVLPKPGARATHSQRHTLQPQPKKKPQGKCSPGSKQHRGRRCDACRSKAGAGQ